MARLLTTQVGLMLDHFFQDIFIADPGPEELYAIMRQALLQPQVAHGCGYYQIVFQASLFFEI